ncbi:MAG: lipid A deacylase LpxR family protein [Kiloniellales bacterium]
MPLFRLRRSGLLLALLLVAQLCCLTGASLAQPDEPDDRWIFTLQVENDTVVATDAHYTNGIQVSLLSPETAVPQWLDGIWDQVAPLEQGAGRRVGYTFGQTMFTPGDIDRSDLILDDRPYAGWLYGGVSLLSYDENNLGTLSLEVGVVGPLSLADETQSFWHDVIGVDRAEGWDNQLENEPGLVLSYERKWRRGIAFPLIGLEVDATPHVGVSLGNIYTYGAGGLTLRIGEELAKDFGPPRIRPSLPGTSYFLSGRNFDWYLFAGVEGRVVGRNIFLDGNTFRDSHSVDKKLFVGDFQVGVVLSFYDSVRLAYTHVLRSKEFEGQDDADRFGAVSLSFAF